METLNIQTPPAEPERLAYSIKEAANLLGVDYFSVYRLIQRGNLRACRALRGKLLVPRSELLRLLKEIVECGCVTHWLQLSLRLPKILYLPSPVAEDPILMRWRSYTFLH